MIWKRAVFALFAVAAGTNVPTPLLLVYQERLDLLAAVQPILTHRATEGRPRLSLTNNM